MKELAASGSLWSLPRRFFGQAVMPNLPRALWHKILTLRFGPTDDPFETWCPMNRDYAEEMQVAARGEAIGFDPLFRPAADSRVLRAKMLTMAGGEGTDTMLAFEAIHGIPSRDPTSYRPLVEFCIGIPDDQYLRGGVRRWLAKRMLKGKVPDMVLSEKQRGRQAADWHLRLSRQREALIEEIDWLKEDPVMARRLNLNNLKQALVEFPKETPRDPKLAARLKLAVSRGLTTARFIRYLEGRNM
jgi:asparagine synthase (glutamine-hydrolysing)